ncbi:MAG TPA: gluconokinase [Puia sp.]|nr:gluconokinase [Puia sp.]
MKFAWHNVFSVMTSAQSIIGIDIGTTNTKGVAFTKEGKVLASVNETYSAVSSKERYHELMPGEVLNAVVTVLKKIIAEIKPLAEIKGISFSCAMHSLMAVAENGKPLTNFMTWADLRSADEATKLKHTDVGNKIYERCGTPIHAMTPICKILWLKNNQPDILSKAYKFIGIKEYFWHEFFGKYKIDYSIASATGMFDIYEFKWNEEALNVAGISSNRLSEVVDSFHAETNLVKKYQEEFSINNVPFIIGGSDGCLANLGSNAIEEGESSLTIGTSGALRMASSKPKHDPKQRIFNYILTKDIYVSGGAMNNGGSVINWYANNFLSESNFKEKKFSEIMKRIDDVEAGSEGLIFLPYLFGERAPIWNENARAVFFGIHSNHQQKHFLRAITEGISFSIYQIGISLEETIGSIKRIYASGGFIQSKTWLQIIADVFNKEVVVLSVSDASAIGAAMIGMKSVGMIQDFHEVTKTFSVQEKFFPDAERNKIYQSCIGKFASLYNKLKDEFSE